VACHRMISISTSQLTMSPAEMVGGARFCTSGVRVIHVNTLWVWPFISVGVALLLESLYAPPFCVLTRVWMMHESAVWASPSRQRNVIAIPASHGYRIVRGKKKAKRFWPDATRR
jgi:hypothetical protein